MTFNDYFAQRRAVGEVSLTAAVGELAAVCGASKRTVWRWVQSGAVLPLYAQRLVRVWGECSLDERERWFC